jgi:hypothetical protein
MPRSCACRCDGGHTKLRAAAGVSRTPPLAIFPPSCFALRCNVYLPGSFGLCSRNRCLPFIRVSVQPGNARTNASNRSSPSRPVLSRATSSRPRAALHDDRERLDESGFEARRQPRQFRKPRGSESDAGGLLIEAMAKPLAVARFPDFLRPRFPSRRALLPVAAVASPLSSYRRPLCLPSLCAGLGDFLWRGLSISTAWPQLTK